ncbi:hypothetical protein [Saccharopolyspora sp. CA-218241]
MRSRIGGDLLMVLVLPLVGLALGGVMAIVISQAWGLPLYLF